MGNNKSETKGTRIILSIGFLFAVGAICFFIFKIPDFWPQMLAIIASAFLGAGATAWITNTLLNNKQKTEEAKEKNIKVYENKINVYSEIVQKLWEILEENDEEMINKIEGLRSYIFQKVVLYLPDEGVANLNNIFSEVGNLYDEDELEKDNETEGNDTDDGKIQKLQRIFSKITFILKKDLEEKNLEKQERTLKTDLKKIKEWINNIIKRIKQYFVFKENSKKEEKTSGDTTKYVSLYNNLSLKKRKETVLQFDMVKSNTNNVEKNEDAYNFWHFIMFDNEQIDEAFKNNKYELSLIEYGETWRTNRVKQVKQGDIVFLFRRGGYGYIGAFIVKGWRVFYFEENREEIQKFENDKLTEVKGEQYEKDIEQYDIYYSKNDGATLCANIIVEPIAFDYEGVKYPGGVYRHTISQYPDHYAKILLSRFLKNEIDKKPSYNKLFENIEMAGVNTDEFNKIINNLNIQPAEKDENGNWKEDNK